MKVFWAWQSDHPGRIARFAVREALIPSCDWQARRSVGGCRNNNGQARKSAVVSFGRYSVGNGSAAYGPSRTSKPTRAPGALPRRYAVPHPWDKQARFNRRRRLAWLFPDAQPPHHRAVRKSTNRSKRPRRTLNYYAVEVGPSNATRPEANINQPILL